MLGSERKGAVAPRVSTILSVLERRSRESRREQTQILDHGPSSQQVQQQEQSKLLSSIPRYLNTYGPRKRRCHVLLLDLGNRLGSNRGLKLQRKKDLARQRQREGGVRSQSSPLRTATPLSGQEILVSTAKTMSRQNVIPGHMAVTKAWRVKKKHQIRNFEHTCNYQKFTLLCKPITVQKTDVSSSPSTSTRGAAHISCDSPSQSHGPAGCIWGRQAGPSALQCSIAHNQCSQCPPAPPTPNAPAPNGSLLRLFPGASLTARPLGLFPPSCKK